jgi:dTDP-4-amino-4,6-dideoxygalactose transaminase
MIKFNDLKKINGRFEKDFHKEFQSLLESGWYISGQKQLEFEKNFASYCGTKFCVGVGNGLDALTIILKAYTEMGKLSKGNEIIVPANTYIATILAITEAGFVPVLVEPDSSTYNISVEEIKKNISKNTVGIMAVHLYGKLAEMELINKVAKANNLLVFEDAAQAHGAKSSTNFRAGNLSNAAAFSFYPTKNLGALGDGGAITTNDENLYECAKKISNYGSAKKDQNEIKGVNSRLDEIQAALLNIKLKELDADNSKRISIAKRYISEITNTNLILPEIKENSLENVFHLFPIRCTNRNKLEKYLIEHEIQTVIHYPTAPHKQKAFKEFNEMSFPITEKIHSQIISIPINPVLTENEVDQIITVLNCFA